jgi:hypothetical protein
LRALQILFMTDVETVRTHVRPSWLELLKVPGCGASVLQAVPNMIELVPEGVNKWVGAQVGIGARPREK